MYIYIYTYIYEYNTKGIFATSRFTSPSSIYLYINDTNGDILIGKQVISYH